MSDPKIKKKKASQKTLNYFNFVSKAKKPRIEAVTDDLEHPAPSDGTSHQNM